MAFHGSDAWLLVVLGSIGEQGARLPRILTIGDYHNHAVFTRAELRGGLVRLLDSGYVTEVDGHFTISGSAGDFCRTLRLTWETLPDAWAKARAFLGIGPEDPVDWGSQPDAESDRQSLTDEAMDAAYDEWRHESNQRLSVAMAFAKDRLPL